MKSPIHLNLLVLRTENLELSAQFYTLLGFVFLRHKHGGGQEHYAAENDGVVFELYPAGKIGSTKNSRFGFRVKSVDETLAILSGFPTTVVTPAVDSEWGRRAVITDPDGNKIELTQR